MVAVAPVSVTIAFLEFPPFNRAKPIEFSPLLTVIVPSFIPIP